MTADSPMTSNKSIRRVNIRDLIFPSFRPRPRTIDLVVPMGTDSTLIQNARERGGCAFLTSHQRIGQDTVLEDGDKSELLH
jgi:hypothetical protein